MSNSVSRTTVSRDKVVSFTYAIVNQEGVTVEQSDIPLSYIHGSPDNHMFPKVEAALQGARIGDQIKIVLPPEDGFGEKDPSLIITDNVENAPHEYRFVGAKPVFQGENGEMKEFTVVHVDDKEIVLDGNPELVGQTVTFVINIVEIRDATGEELVSGMPQGDSFRLH